MKDSRKQLLKLIYDYDHNSGGILRIGKDGEAVGSDKETLRKDIEYLQTHCFINQPKHEIRAYHLSLTGKRRRFC